MIPSADWAPSIIRWHPEAALEWCYLGDLRFTDPFFEQTIRRAMHQPFNLLFGHRTALAEIAAARPQPELRLAGLIFHMSRCGSTVISQMLAALQRNVVLSEPAPLDQIVSIPARLGAQSHDELIPYLRTMVALFSRQRRAEECDLFMKLDAWHVVLLPLLRRAFPEVPWVFVYRDPVAVLASLAGSRPLQMFPGWVDPPLLAPVPPEWSTLTPDAYSAHVLACFLRAAIEHHRDGGLLLEYGELPEAVLTRMLDHFGLDYAEDELSGMRRPPGSTSSRPACPFGRMAQRSGITRA